MSNESQYLRVARALLEDFPSVAGDRAQVLAEALEERQKAGEIQLGLTLSGEIVGVNLGVQLLAKNIATSGDAHPGVAARVRQAVLDRTGETVEVEAHWMWDEARRAKRHIVQVSHPRLSIDGVSTPWGGSRPDSPRLEQETTARVISYLESPASRQHVTGALRLG